MSFPHLPTYALSHPFAPIYKDLLKEISFKRAESEGHIRTFRGPWHFCLCGPIPPFKKVIC